MSAPPQSRLNPVADHSVEAGSNRLKKLGLMVKRLSLFRNLLDCLPQMVWAHEGAVEYYNRRWLEFTGVSFWETDRSSRWNLIHPEDRAGAMAAWEDAQSTGMYEVEYRLRHHSGEYLWVVSRGASQRDEQGKIAAWYGTCTNIHAGKIALAALSESEALNRSIIDASCDSILLLDVNERIIFINDSAKREISSGAAAKIIGRDCVEALKVPYPADVRAAFAAALAGERGSFSFPYTHDTGQEKWWDVAVTSVRGDEGQATGLLVVARDITELRAAQDRLQALQSAIVREYRLAETVGHVGHWRMELPSKKLTWSDEIFRIVGAEPQRGVPSPEEVLNLYHPEDRPKARGSLIRALKTGEGWDFIVRLVRPNGEERHARSHGVAERDPLGKTSAIFGVFADVTELEHARQEAVEATAAKTSFLATMSHEIRTPLNSIIGFTDLLREDRTLSETQSRYLQLIQNAGSVLLTVVNDILDLAKIEAGKIDLQRANFAVETFVDNTVAIVRGAADEKGLEMRVWLDPNLAQYYCSDEGRLRQVLLNLLNNAVKFTSAGYVSFEIRRLAQNAGTHRLRFSVSDTGVGIEPAKQKQLFEAFAQADVSVSRDYGGTGLGLAICEKLVGVMGGRIGLSSSLGAGSTFWFEIDLPPGEKPEIELSPVTNAADLNSGRILLVEDLPMNQELACAILSRAGHEVDVANDGEEAVRAVQQKEYDLVLMDIQMPKVDGITATKMIRALDGPASRLPIVAMTANVLPEQVGEYKRIGMDGHVAKPIDQVELRRVIQSLLKDGGRKHEDAPEGLSPAQASAAPKRLSPDTVTFDRLTFEKVATLLRAERLQKHLASFEEQLTDVFSSRPSADLLKSEAHKLVSQAGMLGFSRLADQCRVLEQAVDEDDDADESFYAAQVAAEEALAIVGTLKADRQS